MKQSHAAAGIVFAVMAAAVSCARNDRPATPRAEAAQAVAPPSPSTAAPSGSARALLHEAVAVLSTQALGRERVDWDSLERELAGTLAESDGAEAAHGAIRTAVSKLNDPHARFIEPPRPTPAATEPPPAATESKQAPASTAAVPRVPTLPEGEILDDGTAFLIVPGCMAGDVDGLRRFARVLSDEVTRLAEAAPKGWVVDLRLNGGGNLWPMLLGLRPLLRDGALMTMTADGAIRSRFGGSEDGVWIDWGAGPEVQLDWGGNPPRRVETRGRIAVLLGPWTMSSGEALAICLSSGPMARTFGEPTAGLTTVTNMYPLSDGSVLNVPVSEMGDVRGVPVRGHISPEEATAFAGWPTRDDAAARGARAWVLREGSDR